MAQVGVSITQARPWRGNTVPWSNVYHYNTELLGMPSESEGVLMLERLREIHKAITSTDTQIIGGKVWGPTGGSIEASKMIADAKWTGHVGTLVPHTSMYRELAFMVAWPLGRYGIKNRKQFLRKWLHPMNNLGLVSAEQTGESAMTGTPTALTTYINAVNPLVVATVGASPFELVTEDGRAPIGPGYAYPYLEHRQFGR